MKKKQTIHGCQFVIGKPFEIEMINKEINTKVNLKDTYLLIRGESKSDYDWVQFLVDT